MKTVTEPKILCIDIETAPHLAYVWNLYDEPVNIERLEESGRVLCFGAKWLGEKRIKFFSEPDDGHDGMVLAAHELLDEADAVMHYNGARFDVPHLNREFVEAGLTPPSPYQQIDLYAVVKRRFKFPSNKLEYVSRALGLEGKVKHEGFELWRKCLEGDAAAWRRMERYNRRDVKLLEDLYRVLLPWVPNLVNRHLYDAKGGCPACGSQRTESRGYYRTKVSRYRNLHCTECGTWWRHTVRERGVTLQQTPL